MNNNYAKDLFQTQSELIDVKVDMAVSKAMEKVMEEFSSLRKEMHSIRHDVHVEISGLRRDMDNQFSALKERVTAIESTLVYVKNAQTQISTKFIEYTFKAGWLILAGSVSYMVAHFFGLIN